MCVLSKCDYQINNVLENFNNQIKYHKDLSLHELVDAPREMVMEKMHLRRLIVSKIQGVKYELCTLPVRCPSSLYIH